MQSRQCAKRRNIGITGAIGGEVIAVEMDRGGEHLAALQALDATHGAFVQRRQSRSGLPQAPFQQIVLAAAHDRRRLNRRHAGRARQPREHPEVQFVPGEKPLAGDLAAGDCAPRNQFIKLAFSQPKVIGSLAGGQEFHPASVCIFLRVFNRTRPES
jgi:hypothetical protein